MEDQEKEASSPRLSMRTVLFWFGAVFTIIAPIIIGVWFKDPSTSWVSALCGAFVTFVSRLDDIAELSLGPVKAKMREAIQEANATVEQLRALAESISGTSLTALMAGNFGFRDGLSLEGRLELHDNLVQSLRKIGLPDQRISELDRKWKQGIGVIYHRAIAPLIDERPEPNRINPNATPKQLEDRAGWDELLEFNQWKVSSPTNMRNYLKSREIENPEIDAWVNDYQHYLETGEIRRRELFVKM